MNRKEYIRDYQRKWIAKRRADFFSGKYCKFCGSMNDLELHHLEPELKISNHIWSWSREKRELEIAKCIVLCYNCHLEETKKQITIEHPCGTLARYNKGCRCELCFEALRQYWRDRRIKLKEEFGPKFRSLNITQSRLNESTITA